MSGSEKSIERQQPEAATEEHYRAVAEAATDAASNRGEAFGGLCDRLARARAFRGRALLR